jgi:hypothetical protein
MRASTLLRPHDQPVDLPHGAPGGDVLLPGREREPSHDGSPEGELWDRRTAAFVRRLVRLVVAVLVILVVLLTAGVLLTGDAPVDEQFPPGPGVEILQE